MQETHISQPDAAGALNARSQANYAIQSNAAEMTRRAACLAVKRCIELLATVHDTRNPRRDEGV